MNYRIKTTKSFDKEIKRLGKHYASIANDYAALLDELAQNPRLGIDLGSGLRKIRGARVITFTVIVSMEESEINLLYIYDKADRPSISTHEIERLLHKNGLR